MEGESSQGNLSKPTPLLISSKGSSETSDLEAANENAAGVYCQPCAPFGISVEPANEFDRNVMQLLELGYTMDIQEISNILTQVGGSVETAEAILQAQYGQYGTQPPDSDRCNQSSDYEDWGDETPDGSSLDGLPELVDPEMPLAGMAEDAEASCMFANFETFVIEDHPITSSYFKYEYWAVNECERFLRSELWKIADVKLNWMHPLWTLHQVFSFLLIPSNGFQPPWFESPMNICEKRAREEWVTLSAYPLPQYKIFDMTRTERIDCPLELRGCLDGPPNSSYAGGKFKMRVLLPNTFPHKPPLVYFDTPIFHPSYDHDGEFLMNPASWHPGFSLRDVIQHVCNLLIVSPDGPLKPTFSATTDMTNIWKSNPEKFSLLAATWTQKLAS